MDDFKEHSVVWTPKHVSRLWDFYSTNPAYKTQYFGYQVGKYVAQETRKHLSDFKSLLDFSCGPGDLLNHFIRGGGANQKFYGCDVSEKSVALVNQRFRNDDRFVEAVTLDDVGRLPEASFDAIISTEVIEHLSDVDLESLIEKVNWLLKPGGKLILTTPNNEDLEASKTLCPECGCVFHRWQHVRSFTKHSLKDLMESHSFETVVLQETYWGPALLKILFFNRKSLKNSLYYIGAKK
jgi:cyclopropane fatty-acyl-phospholipid synthase-like methyltransferase